VPGLLQILISLFFVFGDLGCVIFFTMVSVCKARQARLLKNVNKIFRNFVGQNQRKNENGMKS
jgi:ERCC4-related helicase